MFRWCFNTNPRSCIKSQKDFYRSTKVVQSLLYVVEASDFMTYCRWKRRRVIGHKSIKEFIQLCSRDCGTGTKC